jgi:hypothetical protein
MSLGQSYRFDGSADMQSPTVSYPVSWLPKEATQRVSLSLFDHSFEMRDGDVDTGRAK